MKILFSMRHAGALRNFGSTLRELGRRGHRIHLSFMVADKYGDGRVLAELIDELPDLTYTELTKKTPWRFWLTFARSVRCAADYLRYLQPAYRDADMLRARAQ